MPVWRRILLSNLCFQKLIEPCGPCSFNLIVESNCESAGFEAKNRARLPLQMSLPGAVLFFFASVSNAWALSVLDLQEGQRNIPGTRMESLEDRTGALTLEDVTRPEFNSFVPSVREVPNFGFTTSVYWLRFRLRGVDSQPWLLQIKYPPLDDVSLYTKLAGGSWTQSASGDMHPFSQREIKHRTFLFHITVPRGQVMDVYIRCKTQGSMIIPVEVLRPSLFHSVDHEEQIALGLYYGILLVLTINSLILFFIVRERAYLFYMLYITGYGLFQMNLNGLSFEYLWPGLPAWNNHVLPISIAWAFFWGILFAMEIMDTKRNTPALHVYLKILTIPYVALIVLSFFPDHVSYYVRINIGAAEIIIFSLSVFPVGLRVWFKGYRPARYFVIAWAVFLAGMVFYAFRAFGVIPSNAFTENGMQFGSAVEMSLLALGLADRINLINEEKEQARRREQEARLSVARHQFELLKKTIQPHFLLNSLNATEVWLKEDPDQAALLLHSLADELRHILNAVEKKTISVKDEIDLCRAHLAVMSLRQDRSYSLREHNLRMDEQIPPMIFHTLIENGLTHGFAGRTHGRFILARQRGADRVRYILFNDGNREATMSEGSGTGLRYVKTRLEQTWPGRWNVRAGPVRGGWRVIIDIFDRPLARDTGA